MSERKPLVLDGGNRLAELPAGDTLPASALPAGLGTVTSVAASRGARTATGSAITATGTIYADCVVNPQTGTSYAVAATDRGGLITHSNASATAYTIPQAGSAGFENGFFVRIQNNGAGAVTITPATSTINGSATLVLAQNEWAVVVSNGANYWAMRGTNGSAGGALAVKEAGSVVAAAATVIDFGAGFDVTESPSGEANITLDLSEVVLPETVTINATFDGQGAALIAGTLVHVRVPVACTISEATALADQSGSVVVDVWSDSYANYPPTNADSITASAPITISAATKSTDSTLTGWDKTIGAGDVVSFHVDSCTSITRLNITLKATRT